MANASFAVCQYFAMCFLANTLQKAGLPCAQEDAHGKG